MQQDDDRSPRPGSGVACLKLARTRKVLREALSDLKIQGGQRRRVRNLLSVADKLAEKDRETPSG